MTGTLLALAALLLTAASAGAEHQVYYRYTVIGYVRNAAGAPLRGEGLEVIRDKTGFSYLARTDESGMFLFITRLGDESAGESLTLKYGAASVPLVVRFDPGEPHRGARHPGGRGGGPVRRASRRAFRSTLTQFLGSAQR